MTLQYLENTAVECDYTHLRTSNPIARKNYKCCFCYRTIKIHQRYVYVVHIIEGEFSISRHHTYHGNRYRDDYR